MSSNCENANSGNEKYDARETAMSCCSDDEENNISEKEDKEMTETIARSKEHIRPILFIYMQAWKKDLQESQKRQIEYSVDAFIGQNSNINSTNFYDKKEVVNSIKDARCFFMILQQLQPRTSSKVRKKSVLATLIYRSI